MLWELGEFEGWRARRWPPGALGLMVVVWAPAFAAGVGSFYLGESSDSFPVVGVSVGATLTFGGLASAWSSRRPWRRLIEGRLLAYAAHLDTPPTPDDYAGALIGVEDFSRAMHALRRSGLNASGRSALGLPGGLFHLLDALGLPPRHLRPAGPGERLRPDPPGAPAGRDRRRSARDAGRQTDRGHRDALRDAAGWRERPPSRGAAA